MPQTKGWSLVMFRANGECHTEGGFATRKYALATLEACIALGEYVYGYVVLHADALRSEIVATRGDADAVRDATAKG